MLKDIKTLVNGLKEIKSEKNEKYEIFKVCIQLHNEIVVPYEATGQKISAIEAIEVEESFNTCIKYFMDYAEGLEAACEQVKECKTLNPCFHILLNATKTLYFEVLEILSQTIDIKIALDPIIEECKKEIC